MDSLFDNYVNWENGEMPIVRDETERRLEIGTGEADSLEIRG